MRHTWILGALVIGAWTGSADADRAQNLARADAALADKAAAYGPKDPDSGRPVLKAAFSVDWSSIKDDSRATQWAETCGEFAAGFHEACVSYFARGKVSPACLADVNAKVTKVRCVAQENETERERAKATLQGTTVTYHMTRAGLSRDGHGQLVRPIIPGMETLLFREDIVALGKNTYEADRNEFPMTIDADSFLPTGKNANFAWERCKRGWSFLTLLTSGDCGFDMCKNDEKKAADYLKDVTQLKCVWSAKEAAPSRDGADRTALIYPVGAWNETELEWGWHHFWNVRKQLKLRTCGGQRVWLTGMSKKPGSDPISKECCPKDPQGNCMVPAAKGEPYNYCHSEWAYRTFKKGKGPRCMTADGGVSYSAKQRKIAR